MKQDLFDDQLVQSVLSRPHLVPRPWLERRIDAHLNDPACRIVLVTGEPGAGKSVLLARLAVEWPDSLRYFLRGGGMQPHRSGDVHSFLESIGHQLAARHPQLFTTADLTIKVVQSAERVAPGGRVVGIKADEVLASPFRRTALEVRQDLDQVEGAVSAVEARRVVVDLRSLDWRDVQHLALLGPLDALAAADPPARLLLVIDALDEAMSLGRQPQDDGSRDGLVEWLASCPPLPDTVRIVVSARDDDLLQPVRLRQAHQLKEVRVDTGTADAVSDVSAYLESALDAPVLAEVAETGRDRLIERWVAMAGGNLQYAASLVAGVEGALSRGDVDAARELAEARTVPPGLRPLYTLLVSQIRAFVQPRSVPLLGGGIGSAWSEVYEPVLGTLAVAFEPLTLEELASLSGINTARRQVRAVVRDMAQFLDGRDGYRLHHRSLAEFLTDPLTERDSPECYVDPAEWHATVGMSAGLAVDGATDSTSSTYGLRYACAHMVRAGQVRPLDQSQLDLLGRLTTDLETVEARMAAAGVDAVADDTLAATSLLGPAWGVASGLGRALDRQRHVLRDWEPQRSPLFLVQQVHNEAVELELADLAAAAADRLAGVLGPRIRMVSSKGGMLALRRTIEVGAPVHGLDTVDADHVVAACGDGSVRLYQVSTGRLLKIRQLTGGAVLVVAWSREHGAVWGSADGRVGRWRLGSDDITELVVPGVTGAPSGVTVDMEIFMTSLNREQHVWLQGGPTSVHAISVRADGGVAVGTRQGAVLIVEPSFTTFAAGFPLHEKVVTGLHFSSEAIIVCSHDGRIRRTDLTAISTLRTAECAYTGLAVTEDGTIAVTRWDGGMDVIGMDQEGRSGRKDVGPATAVAAGPGNRLFAGFLNRRIWVMDADLTFHASLRGHGEEISAMTAPALDTLASGSTDGTIRVWSLDEAVMEKRPTGHDGPVSALLFDQSGLLLSGSADGSLRRWEPSGEARDAYDPGLGQIWRLCALPDGTVAMATQSGAILLVGPSGDVLRGHAAEVRGLDVLQDSRLVSVGNDGVVIAWEQRGGRWHPRRVARLIGNPFAVVALDSGLAAIATGEEEVPVVDVDSGQIRTLHGHRGGVYSVAAGLHGTLLSGAHDATARVWNLDTGECRLVYDWHESDVSALGMLRGSLVLSGSGDRTIRIWNIETGETIAVAALDQPVDCLAVSSRGDRIAVGHANGAICVLRAEGVPDV
jgi:WD40 repeat protein